MATIARTVSLGSRPAPPPRLASRLRRPGMAAGPGQRVVWGGRCALSRVRPGAFPLALPLPAMPAPVDNTLLELFRTEVELHSETLTAGMLALEQAPADEATLERLMRASHSIKGAARIVQMTPCAEIAHALEDCFVAAQRKTVQLVPAHIDALLKGVDLLTQCATATRAPNWDPAPLRPLATDYVARLKQLLQGSPQPVAPPPGPASPASSPTAPTTPAPTAAAEPAPTAPAAPARTAPAFAAPLEGVAQVGDPGTRSGFAPGDAPFTHSPAIGSATSDSPRSPANATVICPACLDRQSAELTRRQVLATLALGPGRVTLDCSATVDFDAGGLAFLVAAERHCAGLSRPLRLAPVSDTLRELLPLVGLEHLLGDPV